MTGRPASGPPLNEQHRIVAKVDALMQLCDALESRLKERAGVQGRLAGELEGSVVKEYLTTAAYGKNYRTLYYNLDMILAIGYRVRSYPVSDISTTKFIFQHIFL